MSINLSCYQGPDDLKRQTTFWTRATSELPLCWKATISPALYAKGTQFDPRSRCFAFEGDRLVGYMSFTGRGDFVSLGYPWVLAGYEGELQEKLYDTVYGFAGSSQYGGKVFAQRFRTGWDPQMSFFKRHGFREERRDPIFTLTLETGLAGRPAQMSVHASEYQVDTQKHFEWELLSTALSLHANGPVEHLPGLLRNSGL